MHTKEQILKPLAALRESSVVVTTMGVVQPWAEYSASDLDFASADSAMGHAADMALGIALSQPQRRVICLNGDGSMLMSLGTLVTIAQSAAPNLILFIIENGTYEITGNQPVPGAGFVDYAAMARGAGFAQAFVFDDAPTYERELPHVLSATGPTLVVVRVEPGTEGPLARGPQQEAHYLRVSLAESAHRLRTVLTGTESTPSR